MELHRTFNPERDKLVAAEVDRLLEQCNYESAWAICRAVVDDSLFDALICKIIYRLLDMTTVYWMEEDFRQAEHLRCEIKGHFSRETMAVYLDWEWLAKHIEFKLEMA